MIAEDCAGLPMRIQGSARDTSARLSCHLTCDKGRQAPARAKTNCRQVQQKALEDRLPERLIEHEEGRGARLTQVQREAGGTWRLASVEPGGTDRKRQLKQHGATRRCPICKTEAEAALHERWQESTSPQPAPSVQPEPDAIGTGMSEQPVTHPGVTINYEAAAMSALIAPGMTGGQGPDPSQPSSEPNRLAAANLAAEPELVAEPELKAEPELVAEPELEPGLCAARISARSLASLASSNLTRGRY